MEKEVLIVIRDIDLRERVEDILKNLVPRNEGDRIFVDRETNEMDARHRLSKRRYDLLVAHIHIAANSGSTLNENEKRGLELARLAERHNSGLSNILISPPGDDSVWRETQRLSHCKLVPSSQHFETELVEFCRDALYGAGSVEREPGATVHFTFNLDRNIWSYQINAKGINEIYRPYGELKIEPEIMELLARFSCRVVGSDWEENLRSIGRTLAKQIFRGTPEFIEAFSKLQMLVRNHEKIRFHFTVEKSVHPVALEAALCEDEEFWMLRAPIYRSLDVSPVVYPLFEGPHDTCKGMNCLIIVADASGLVRDVVDDHGNVIELNELMNVETERDQLWSCFEAHKEQCGLGKIEVIGAMDVPGDKSFRDHLKDVLTQDVWDLVHYAGHTYFKEKAGRGYIMLPGENGIDAVDMEVFSSWLRLAKSRFVYFSSCKSSNVAFVFEVASKSIPAILGFRWDIDDDKAAEHARCFYDHLFGACHSLEYAFFETRKHMHASHIDNSIWASAMLILQAKE